MVTSELDMPDAMVMDHYKGLWQIEESFRLTKSDLEARPVYVSTQDHINAHFLTCFVALLLLRLVQLKTNHEHTAGQLLGAMRKMNGTLLPNKEYVFDHYSDVANTLGEAFNIDFNRRFLNKKKYLLCENLINVPQLSDKIVVYLDCSMVNDKICRREIWVIFLGGLLYGVF